MQPSRRLLAALALLLTPLAGSGQIVEKSFRVRLYAPHLEPGLGGAAWTPGDEMLHGGIQWTSASEGRLEAAMWRQKGIAAFRLSPDGKSVAELGVELGGDRGLDVWRWRHGYLKRGRDYVWSTLADHPEPVAPSLAEALDEFIFGAWRLWAGRRLKSLLNGASETVPMIEDGSSPAEIEKDFTLRFNRQGLVGTSYGDFHIRLWHIPAHVRFAVKAAKPGPYNRWILQLARPLEIRFESDKQEEWRRRHGYSRDRFGGYAWDSDFPEPRPAIAAFGPRFDELMRRGVDYWADAAVHQILDRLDLELKKELGLPPGAASALAEGPALEGLRALESGRPWPN